MKLEEFVKQVKKLRDQQKKYFKTRGSDDLIKSKELELKLDKTIVEYEKSQKPELFK